MIGARTLLCRPTPLSASSSSAALTRDILSDGLARGAAGATWDDDDENDNGSATPEDKGLLVWMTARVDDKIWKYHARVAALKRSQEAATSTMEPVACRKRGIY